MKKLLVLIVMLLASIFVCSAKGNFVKAAKSSESVVLVNSYSNGTFIEFGTGIVINKNGYIVTCHHVISTGDSFVVIHNNDTLVCKLVGSFINSDISVLKVDKKMKPIKIRKSKLHIGEEVLSIGYPIGLDLTVTNGIISGFTPNVGKSPHIQTNAVVNPGSSGGPLVDKKGRLIGINDLIVSPTGFYIGYSFSIPIKNVLLQIHYAIDFNKLKIKKS